MGKLVRTIVIIIIAFTLASLFLYRLRLGHGASPREKQRPQASDMIEAEGEVSEVDEGKGQIVLKDKDQSIVLKFDGLTSITESGKPISPSTITPGATATVLYTQRNGKNRARSISLTRPPPGRY